MSSLTSSLLSVHAPDELSVAMLVQEEAPVVPEAEFNTAGLDLRTFPEFVRDIECDVTFAWEPGERYCGFDYPATVELISVKTLDGRDLLPELDEEEKQYLINVAMKEATDQDERVRRMRWGS